MSYAVRIPVYEGPFELLLHLILKEEVDIWDVKIAEVIDAFQLLATDDPVLPGGDRGDRAI